MADSLDTAEWKKFVADYKANFKDGFPSPSLFAYLYYINTKAALDGLDAVKGDLSGGQKKYREALQKTKFVGPAGEVVIDANRNGVGTTYITEVTKAADGSLFNKVVKTVPNVTQTLGLPEAEFKKMGLGTRDIPDCRK
jgi:branched-chain amino acid transport system substrate-binding protein